MSALMHAIIYLLSPVQMGSLVEWCCGEACCFEGMTQENRRFVVPGISPWQHGSIKSGMPAVEN